MKLPDTVTLYAISDTGFDHLNYFQELLQAGIDIIQLRDKSLSDRKFYEIALRLRELTRASKTLFILNDRVDVACLVDADGVHLGREDLAPGKARELLGQAKLIGYSCHSLEEARFAQSEGVDYISIGPIFRSPTKKELEPIGRNEIELIHQEIGLPKFAIGGIELANLKIVKEMGFEKVALLSSLASAPDKKELIQQIKRSLKSDPDSEA